jgi:hypothetical protein
MNKVTASSVLESDLTDQQWRELKVKLLQTVENFFSDTLVINTEALIPSPDPIPIPVPNSKPTSPGTQEVGLELASGEGEGEGESEGFQVSIKDVGGKTYFIDVKGDDYIDTMRYKIITQTSARVHPDNMILMYNGRVLHNDFPKDLFETGIPKRMGTIASHKIAPGSIIFLGEKSRGGAPKRGRGNADSEETQPKIAKSNILEQANKNMKIAEMELKEFMIKYAFVANCVESAKGLVQASYDNPHETVVKAFYEMPSSSLDALSTVLTNSKRVPHIRDSISNGVFHIELVTIKEIDGCVENIKCLFKEAALILMTNEFVKSGEDRYAQASMVELVNKAMKHQGKMEGIQKERAEAQAAAEATAAASSAAPAVVPSNRWMGPWLPRF